jgi:CheY-like chemotaxis protein
MAPMDFRTFDEVLVNATDFVFHSLGESCQRALYFHLKKTFHIRRDEIPERIAEFDDALKFIFKDGAVFLEKSILQKVCVDLRVKLENGDTCNFVRAISQIKSLVADRELQLNGKEEVKRLNYEASILVVEDDAELRKTLSSILEKEGYSVKAVENGGQAIEASKAQNFNAALIDVRLPDMDGTELTDKLKETEPKMVKIIVTGYPSLKNAIEAVNRGVDGYVLKPFDPRELLAMIKKHLKRQREDMETSEKKVANYIETRMRQIKFERGKNRDA